MFEQTLLTNEVSGRKTGAIAMAAMAQIAVAGVLVVAPLLYTQTMNFVPAQLPGVVFTKPTPPPPVTQIADQVVAGPSRPMARVFVPTSVPKGVRQIVDRIGEFTTLPTLENLPVAIGGPDIAVAGPVTMIPVVPPPTVTTAKPPEPIEITKPVRVSGGVLAAKLIAQIVPKYPPLARQTRVSGTVRLLGVIAKDGRVRDLRVIDGPPLLRGAALDAVSQWVYAPTLLGGQAVEVEAPIEVHFQLN
jgi:protein TonB